MKKPAAPYRILGIDPGTNLLGYAILEVHGRQLAPKELGVVKMTHLKTHQEKLKKIFERLQALIDVHAPSSMAIEAPFFGKNVQAMLKLGRAQGVAIAAGMTKNVPVTEYAPRKIKQSVTGKGNASKEQVQAMLEQILKFPLADHYLDATDALATALCHHYQSGNPLAGTKRYTGWEAFLTDNPGRKG